VLAMIGYAILGLTLDPNTQAVAMGGIGQTIEAHFHPGPLHLLPPVVVVGLVLRKRPALPVLLLGVVLGALVAITAEGATVGDALRSAMSGYQASTGDPAVDELLSRGGMSSMASTVFLVL